MKAEKMNSQAGIIDDAEALGVCEAVSAKEVSGKSHGSILYAIDRIDRQLRPAIPLLLEVLDFVRTNPVWGRSVEVGRRDWVSGFDESGD